MSGNFQVEPFWNIYQQHLAADTQALIHTLLKDMRIGPLPSSDRVGAALRC